MKKPHGFAIVFIFLASSLPGSALGMGSPKPLPPLETVEKVDLDRYMGLWYEIGRLPQSFEKNCVGVTAEYTLRNDGKVDVLNSCHVGTLDGKLKTARGIGKVVDSETHAKLKVTFFWPFYGDYWILELGQEYEYAVVGSPDRKSLWILSRSASISDDLWNAILDRFSKKDFDLSQFYKTPQEQIAD